MRIVPIKDNELFDLKAFCSFTDLDEKTGEKLLYKLIINQFVKGSKKDEINVVEHNVNQNSLFPSQSKKIPRFSFDYVGLVSCENICFLIYPKYIKSVSDDVSNGLKKFKQIIEVIRKISNEDYQTNGINSYTANDQNMLLLTLNLIDYFHRYGLYTTEKYKIEENGGGSILWNKTINQKIAYIINNHPFYLDLFTLSKFKNADNICCRLNKAILSQASIFFTPILSILGIEPVILTNESVEEIGHADYLISIINNELASQYITYKQEILLLLKAFLLKVSEINNSGEIITIGTRIFYYTWEKVCAKVADSIYDMRIVDLGYQKPEGLSDAALFKDIIPKPIWSIYNNDFVVKDTLILDVVHAKQNTLSIYDAKYYCIEINNKGVLIHQPGVEDIVKQYAYELSLQNFSEQNNLIIKENTFLFPADINEIQDIGCVHLDIFEHMDPKYKLHDIKVLLLPCEKVFTKFLTC